MLNSVRRRLQIDWMVSNLRWLLLVVVVLVAFLDPQHGFGGPSSLYLFLLLGLAAIYNLVVTLLLATRTFSNPLPTVTIWVDAALAVGLIAVSGGIESLLIFFSLLPIITAALRFSIGASLSVAFFIALGYFLIGFLQPQLDIQTIFSMTIGDIIVLLLASLVTGLVGERMKRWIAMTRRKEEKEQVNRSRTRHKQSRLIFELASTLSATLNYERVLEAILDVGELGLQELRGEEIYLNGIVLLFQQNELYIAASRHLPPRDQQNVLDGTLGVIAQALSTAEPVLCTQPGQDPELGQFVAFHHCKETVVVPLRAGFENFGVAVFGSQVEDTFTAAGQDLLVALCNQGVVALQNAQLYQSLMEEKERIVAVEEDARKKLARDLHDGPTQSIAAIAMRANYTRSLIQERPQEVPDELSRIEELARRTTKEIRHMLFTLRPLILETQGLRAALEQYILKRAETDPLPIELQAPEGVDRRLSKDQQGMIFYITEEAISNARKHAQADHIWVRLARDDQDNFVIQVEDDGVGFDVSIMDAGYEERGSLGMLNMHERAELAGGKMTVESTLGKGTKVTLRVTPRGV